MKFTANLWNQKYDGIQFFVQRLEEMLFHYSDDIVRAPVHNASISGLSFTRFPLYTSETY